MPPKVPADPPHHSVDLSDVENRLKLLEEKSVGTLNSFKLVTDRLGEAENTLKAILFSIKHMEKISKQKIMKKGTWYGTDFTD